MTNVSPWTIRTFTFLSMLASSVPCIALSHLESWCNFAGASKPRDMIHSITHKPHYIFLKTATIPTYHGISIAIPVYIAMHLLSSIKSNGSSFIHLSCSLLFYFKQDALSKFAPCLDVRKGNARYRRG